MYDQENAKGTHIIVQINHHPLCGDMATICGCSFSRKWFFHSEPQQRGTHIASFLFQPVTEMSGDD